MLQCNSGGHRRSSIAGVVAPGEAHCSTGRLSTELHCSTATGMVVLYRSTPTTAAALHCSFHVFIATSPELRRPPRRFTAASTTLHYNLAAPDGSRRSFTAAQRDGGEVLRRIRRWRRRCCDAARGAAGALAARCCPAPLLSFPIVGCATSGNPSPTPSSSAAPVATTTQPRGIPRRRPTPCAPSSSLFSTLTGLGGGCSKLAAGGSPCCFSSCFGGARHGYSPDRKSVV